jgi:hypothetical protein
MNYERGSVAPVARASSIIDARRALSAAVSKLALGERVYARPESTKHGLHGELVEVDRLVLALRTREHGVVWVHGSDCPDVVRTSDV